MIGLGFALLIYTGEFLMIVCFKHIKIFIFLFQQVLKHMNFQMKVHGFYMKKYNRTCVYNHLSLFPKMVSLKSMAS